jgi:ABC-type uncharacterized transport system
MATNIQTPPDKTTTDWVDQLARYKNEFVIGLHAMAGLFAVLTLVIFFQYKTAGFLLCIWAAALGLVYEAVALWFITSRPPSNMKDSDRVRLALLTVLGATGLGLVLLGMYLPFIENYWTVLSGGLSEWRKKPFVLINIGASLFGGLVLIFIGVQLARAYERSQAGMRRLLYGYNDVLAFLLLLSILVLVNVLTYVWIPPFDFFGRTFDWTSKNIYTLTPSSINFLKNLDQPVKVYVMLTRTDNTTLSDVENLLENCRSYNPNLTWTALSPNLNREKVKELVQKYKIADPEGLLVLYGPEKDDLSDFIRRDELSNEVSAMREGGARFNGEYALFKSLNLLASGKAKAKIYFLQGDGEMDVESRDDKKPEAGLGEVFSKLNEGNYELKKFQFGVDPTDDLKNADVVVAAGPRKFSDEAVKALGNYLKETQSWFRITDKTLSALGTEKVPDAVVAKLKPLKEKAFASQEQFVKDLSRALDKKELEEHKTVVLDNAREGSRKGKLLLLMDIHTTSGGKMEPTGLEPLLQEYNVRVNNDLVLAAKMKEPLLVFGMLNPRTNNEIARAFQQTNQSDPQFAFYRTRSVEPISRPRGQETPPPKYSVEPLIFADPNYLPWSETRLDSDPLALAADRRKDPQTAIREAIQRPLMLAVAVTEPGSRGDRQPVMLVFGDASWIGNVFQRNEDNLTLLSSCLSWLRGKPDLGRKPSDYTKIRDKYELKLQPTELRRLLLLPGLLLLVSVVVLGGGVWVVRRR